MIIATLGVLVVVALALAIIPSTRDEIHWRWASHKDETASYESYVKTWPEGRHTAEAQARYDQHGWANAESANSVQAFERYIKLHGEGKHVVKAKDNIESLRWREATTANTIRSYKGYVANLSPREIRTTGQDRGFRPVYRFSTLRSRAANGYRRFVQGVSC
jgi:hypothetical protein